MKKFRLILVLIAIVSILLGIAVFLLTGGLKHDVSPLVALGEKYLEEGDYEEAALQFEKAITIAKKSPEAWYGAARAYIGLGNEDEAKEALLTLAGFEPSQKDKVDWMIEKIEAGEGEELILLPYDAEVTSDEEYLEYIGAENATETVSETPQTTLSEAEWKAIYKDYLLNSPYAGVFHYPWHVVDVNGDGVPELILAPDDFAAPGFIFTIANGQVCANQEEISGGPSFSYNPLNGYVCVGSGQMGSYYDQIFQVTSNGIEMVFDEWYSDDDTDHEEKVASYMGESIDLQYGERISYEELMQMMDE